MAAGGARATVRACKPCVEVRGLAGAALDRRIKLGGMNDFYTAAKGPDARVINYWMGQDLRASGGWKMRGARFTGLAKVCLRDERP